QFPVPRGIPREWASRALRHHGQWQNHGECCPATQTGTVRPNGSSVQLDQLLADRKTQAETAVLPRGGRFILPKPLEKLRQKFRVNALSCVRDDDYDFVLGAHHREFHLSTSRSKLDRIHQEVPYHLPEANGVGEDHARRGAQLGGDANTLCLCGRFAGQRRSESGISDNLNPTWLMEVA